VAGSIGMYNSQEYKIDKTALESFSTTVKCLDSYADGTIALIDKQRNESNNRIEQFVSNPAVVNTLCSEYADGTIALIDKQRNESNNRIEQFVSNPAVVNGYLTLGSELLKSFRTFQIKLKEKKATENAIFQLQNGATQAATAVGVTIGATVVASGLAASNT